MHRLFSGGSFALVAVSVALAASAQAPPKAPAPKPTPAGRAAPSKPKRAAPASRTKPTSPVTSLDVVVTDPAGEPVEGARVVAIPVQGAFGLVAGGRAQRGDHRCRWPFPAR